ncbi:MAG: DUF2155 domain-containing protein [Janthinobacterium lividum]
MIAALALAIAAAAVAVPAAKPAAPTVKLPAKVVAATPLADRVVRLAALNKRNGTVQEFSVKPGETVRFATLTIRVRACETTPPWEQRLTGAYLQIDDAPIRVRSAAPPRAERVYSGWMYAESPSLNPLQHPLYDVWVRSCAMSFPETGPGTIVVGRGSGSADDDRPPRASIAPKSPVAPVAPSN